MARALQVNRSDVGLGKAAVAGRARLDQKADWRDPPSNGKAGEARAGNERVGLGKSARRSEGRRIRPPVEAAAQAGRSHQNASSSGVGEACPSARRAWAAAGQRLRSARPITPNRLFSQTMFSGVRSAIWAM